MAIAGVNAWLRLKDKTLQPGALLYMAFNVRPLQWTMKDTYLYFSLSKYKQDFYIKMWYILCFNFSTVESYF